MVEPGAVGGPPTKKAISNSKSSSWHVPNTLPCPIIQPTTALSRSPSRSHTTPPSISFGCPCLDTPCQRCSVSDSVHRAASVGLATSAREALVSASHGHVPASFLPQRKCFTLSQGGQSPWSGLPCLHAAGRAVARRGPRSERHSRTAHDSTPDPQPTASLHALESPWSSLNRR
eukprot:3506639-Rhodomonas_salina.1